MPTLTRLVAAMQLVLIFPAALFLSAVLVGLGDPPQYDLARVAQRITMWYGGLGKVGLWGLLITLPFAVLISGYVTLLRSWNRDVKLPQTARPSLAMIPAPLATLLVAGTTLTSSQRRGPSTYGCTMWNMECHSPSNERTHDANTRTDGSSDDRRYSMAWR